MRVLVADDNRDLALNIAEVLELHGYTAVTAFDGAGAVRAAMEQLPDFVILDIRMPDMNGVDAFRQIKALAPRVEGVLITGHALDDIIAEGMLAGVHDVLRKPFSYDQLLNVLERHKGHLAG
jgi:CheY-like chemotaxis protein